MTSMGYPAVVGGARNYSNGLGRFYSPDPSKGVDPRNPASWNKYIYVLGDPVNFNDLSGLNASAAECPNDPTTSNCTDPTLPSGGFPTGFALIQSQLEEYLQAVDSAFSAAAGQFSDLKPISALPASVSRTEDCIASGLQSTFSASAVVQGDTAWEGGGHWNFQFTLQFNSLDAANNFVTTYSQLLNENKIPPPVRLPDDVHFENVADVWTLTDGVYSISGTAHLDLANANQIPFGLLGHWIIDGIGGNVAQFFGGDIDPAHCPF